MDRLHVATLNIRNLADRWFERLRGAVRMASARLVFDRPDPEDPTIYPSDHLGIAAQLEIGEG